MKSKKHLEDLIKYYKEYTEQAEKERDELRIKLDKAQQTFELNKNRLSELEETLRLVREDFGHYGGWNPAG